MEKKTADGIMVHCLHDKLESVTNMVPHEKNPNKHPREQIRLLGKIIHDTGWRNSITISSLSGKIIKGHCRLQAAKYMGWTQVPIEIQKYDNEYSELADLVADNKIAELAKMDDNELIDILNDIKDASIDLELTGFTELEFEEMAKTKVVDEDEFLTSEFELPDGDINEREVMERVVLFVKSSLKKQLLDAIYQIENDNGLGSIRLTR